MRVKTARLQRVRPREGAPRRAAGSSLSRTRPQAWPRTWLRRAVVRAARGAPSCSPARSLVDEYEHADVMRVVLARAARSARLTTHFDLDFPRDAAARARTGATSIGASAAPVDRAAHFLAATRSTRWRGSRRSRACAPAAARRSSCTATRASSNGRAASTPSITSPPYPGLIDYHEQHRYAYELLGLDDRREREIGAAAAGTSRAALAAYIEGSRDVLRRAAGALRPRRARADRRQRPARPLPGDPRARRAQARRSGCAATSTAAPVGGRASTSRTSSSSCRE